MMKSHCLSWKKKPDAEMEMPDEGVYTIRSALLKPKKPKSALRCPSQHVHFAPATVAARGSSIVSMLRSENGGTSSSHFVQHEHFSSSCESVRYSQVAVCTIVQSSIFVVSLSPYPITMSAMSVYVRACLSRTLLVS